MTVVKTKIGQDPLINKVLLNSDTVRPYRSLPARAIRMSTFASNPFFTIYKSPLENESSYMSMYERSSSRCGRLSCGFTQPKTHRASSTKIDACLWSLVCGLQPGGWYELYPRSVPTPIDTASISLFSVKYLLLFGALFLGETRGGFCSIMEFFKLPG